MPKPIFEKPLKTDVAALDVIFITKEVIKLLKKKKPFPQLFIDRLRKYQTELMDTPLPAQSYLNTWRILNELLSFELGEVVCPWLGVVDGHSHRVSLLISSLEDELPKFIEEYRKNRADHNLLTEV